MDMVNTNEILQKYGLRLTKSLGQNFLTDINIIDKIVEAADVGSRDLVLEIGPGIGSMTVRLGQSAGKVVAVEIDRHLIPPLQETLAGYDNVSVVHADALKVDLHAIVDGWDGPLKVVSNLPYYITTPLIMRLLESDIAWETLVFMVQKEVAVRIAAQPGGKDYSTLSVAVRAHADPKLAFTVSRHCFVPKPDVDSAVVALRKTARPELAEVSMPRFFRVVKAAFSQRRKMILNSLAGSNLSGLGKEVLREALAAADIAETDRAEVVPLEKFARLTVALAPRLGNSAESDAADDVE